MQVPLPGHSVNAAFLQELKDSHLELTQTLQQLRQLCSDETPPAEVSAQAGKLLQLLRDYLSVQFSLEETYGYVRCPAEMHVALQAKTKQALFQHNLLYVSLVELSERVDNMQYRGTLERDIGEVVSDLKAFLAALHEHESLEQEMIQIAYGSRYQPSS